MLPALPGRRRDLSSRFASDIFNLTLFPIKPLPHRSGTALVSASEAYPVDLNVVLPEPRRVRGCRHWQASPVSDRGIAHLPESFDPPPPAAVLLDRLSRPSTTRERS